MFTLKSINIEYNYQSKEKTQGSTSFIRSSNITQIDMFLTWQLQCKHILWNSTTSDYQIRHLSVRSNKQLL